MTPITDNNSLTTHDNIVNMTKLISVLEGTDTNTTSESVTPRRLKIKEDRPLSLS